MRALCSSVWCCRWNYFKLTTEADCSTRLERQLGPLRRLLIECYACDVGTESEPTRTGLSDFCSLEVMIPPDAAIFALVTVVVVISHTVQTPRQSGDFWVALSRLGVTLAVCLLSQPITGMVLIELWASKRLCVIGHSDGRGTMPETATESKSQLVDNLNNCFCVGRFCLLP